jgi:hypothetical protein
MSFREQGFRNIYMWVKTKNNKKKRKSRSTESSQDNCGIVSKTRRFKNEIVYYKTYEYEKKAKIICLAKAHF